MQTQILVIEDDELLNSGLCYNLQVMGGQEKKGNIAVGNGFPGKIKSISVGQIDIQQDQVKMLLLQEGLRLFDTVCGKGGDAALLEIVAQAGI